MSSVNAEGRLEVVLVGPGFHFLSGLSAYTCTLANELSREHDVSVLLLRRVIPRRLYPTTRRSPNTGTALRYGNNVTRIGELDWYWFPGLLGALARLRATKPNLVVLQWWTTATLHTYILVALFARVLGIRVVVEFHETQDTSEALVLGVDMYCRRGMPLLLSLAHGALVHNNHDLELLRRTFGSRPFDRLDIETAPHGPYTHIADSPADSPASHDSRSGPTRLLFFGLIRPYKGLDDLLVAFNQLSAEQAAQFHLTIVGETWENWQTPAALISASPHRRRITFVNRYVSDAEAGQFFRDTDVVVLPYRRASASGPLQIAMHSGLHVVLYAVGGLVEATRTYEGAHLVEPDNVDALRRTLMSIPPDRHRRFTDHTSWSTTLRAIERLARS
ncbi:glycosyl transferase [Rhodococcus sp. AD45-ID]|uniref:glycosyltransferase n=1 Tax=unclassified Rhodococcus (in: high G+C Gram-positive bacteria) TaxID=192944 RepID=UPI0005D3F07E|nr:MULTISPECIES: glycosyltransferase [unclassified Rhodococcus (in: high G+C Gram-positive bacteria)]KJF20490.1 PEP-CTERM/exosortase A-associated glycosyltransferase, family [Rhodococcus sp. AD45]PSR41543.1 glycosyl transferase [Rhodococcus sp. AD45-ID]